MAPTRPAALAAVAAVLAAAALLLADAAYGSLPALPVYASVPLGLLAVAELAMARVVRDRVRRRGRPTGRPLHPVQVARAAVLAKASSLTGAVLLGAYAGLLGWLLPRRDTLVAAERDALVAAVSALAALALVVTALLLERACRTPDEPG